MQNTKTSRKPYIITGALFVYAVVMAVVNRETLTVYHDYLRYFGTIAAEALVLVLLFFFLRRREQLRAERKADLERARKEKETNV